MSTKQSEKSRMDQGNWNKIFPIQVEQTEQSFSFVKKLVAVGVSNILYMRGALVEDAFQDQKIDGLKFKILNPNPNAAENQQVRWDIFRLI